MQRSSKSIASLAAALAKAQAELVNPEKSLVGTIRSDNPGGGDRLFRYAPLSSGLEIVRKTLGEHEIAVVQTTTLDQTTGVVNLTTMLAHSSGEWIASDWPVCAISETATPHRMGAALTYARRYALFTLVGIAGEDDLDAPDLMTPTRQTPGPERPKGDSNGRLNGGQPDPGRRAPVRRNGQVRSNSAAPMLGPEASAELRDRLLAELCDLGSGDDAALWAYRCLSDKNRLTVGDAERVEEAFTARLAAVVPPSEDPATSETCRRGEPCVLSKPWRPSIAVAARATNRVSVRQLRPDAAHQRSRNTTPHSDGRKGCGRRASIRACSLCRSRAGFVTGITSGSLPSSLASFAVDSHRMPTTCALRKVQRSAVRSAMNSPCHCAGDTIARSTTAATNPCGG